MRASALCRRPRTRSSGCTTGWAVGTTRRVSRSSVASARSSLSHRRPDRRQGQHSQKEADPDLGTQPGSDRHGRELRRDLRARDEPHRPDDRRAGAPALQGPADRERRHRDMKQTLKVRPIFLHNDDRVYALLSIVGIALLIFGLIERKPVPRSARPSRYPDCCPKARREAHRSQHPRRVPRPRPHLHAHRHPTDRLTDTQQHILDHQSTPAQQAEEGN